MVPKPLLEQDWDKDDERLMSFFGLDIRHPERGLPHFGSDIRVDELRDARVAAFEDTMGEGKGYMFGKRRKRLHESSTLTTPLNLAWRFGYIAWGTAILHSVAAQYPGETADFTRLLLKAGEDKFIHEHVNPLREYLEWKWQIYFYCVPAMSYETQLKGGIGSFQIGGLPILCLLPKFPQVALDRGEHETKVRQVAGQVLWLVRSSLCINCKDQSEEKQDLIEVITAWKNYVTLFHLIGELVKIEKNNPSLITPQVRQALLPEAVLDLLRLSGQTHEGRDHNGGYLAR